MSDDLKLGRELFDLMADQIRAQTHLLDAGLHRRDADCLPFLHDEVCTRCGRDHSIVCTGCGGRAFHRATCVDQADAEAGR